MKILGYVHFYKRKIKKKNKRKFIEQIKIDLLPEFICFTDSNYLKYKYKENREQSIIKL